MFKMKLRTKLILSFVFTSLLGLMVGLVGYMGMNSIMKSADQIGGTDLPSVQALLTISQNQTAIKAEERTLLNLDIDLARRKHERQQIAAAWKNINNAWKVYEKIPLDSEDKVVWNKFVPAWQKWQKGHQQFLNDELAYEQTGIVNPLDIEKDLIEKGLTNSLKMQQVYKADEIYDAMNKRALVTNSQLFKDAEKLLNELIDMNEKQAATSGGEADRAQAAANFNLIVALLAALLLSVGLGFYHAQAINKAIQKLVEGANAIKDGDLTRVVTVSSQDELGELATTFNKMSKGIKQIVNQVAEATEVLAATSQELSATSEEAASASEEIAKTIAELAAGASTQAKSIDETSTVIEQLSAATQQVSANTENVSQSTSKVSEAAKDGLEQIENAVQKIEDIKTVSGKTSEVINALGEQSKEIGNIVDVIKGIADQTNLLALNAAIEAARAGEQGRGFAVVAEEVRKLAEQSASSAEQIAGLINSIQKDTNLAVTVMEDGNAGVLQGVEAVTAASVAFKTIVTEIEQVVDQILQVSAASEQMASGSNEAVQSITSVAAIAEETAASTEQVSAATEEQMSSMGAVANSAQELVKLGTNLQNLTAKFRI